MDNRYLKDQNNPIHEAEMEKVRRAEKQARDTAGAHLLDVNSEGNQISRIPNSSDALDSHKYFKDIDGNVRQVPADKVDLFKTHFKDAQELTEGDIHQLEMERAEQGEQKKQTVQPVNVSPVEPIFTRRQVMGDEPTTIAETAQIGQYDFMSDPDNRAIAAFENFRQNKDLYKDGESDYDSKRTIGDGALYDSQSKHGGRFKHNRELREDINDFLQNTPEGRQYKQQQLALRDELSHAIDALSKTIQDAKDDAVMVEGYREMRDAIGGFHVQKVMERGNSKDIAEASLILRELENARDALSDVGNFGATRQVWREFTRKGHEIATTLSTMGLGGHALQLQRLNTVAGVYGDAPLTQEAFNLLTDYEGLTALDRTIAQDIAKGIVDNMEFVANFTGSGAIVRAVTKGAGKEAIKQATKLTLKQKSKRMGKKIARTLTTAAGAKYAVTKGGAGLLKASGRTALQAALMPSAYVLAYEETVLNPEVSFLDAFADSYSDMVIEVIAENFGDHLPEIGFKNPYVKRFTELTGVHSLPAEFAEEQLETLLSIGKGTAEWADFFDWREQGVTLGVLMLSQAPRGAVASAGYAAGKAQQANRLRSINKAYSSQKNWMSLTFGSEAPGVMGAIDNTIKEVFTETLQSEDESAVGRSLEDRMQHMSEEWGWDSDQNRFARLYAHAAAPKVGADMAREDSKAERKKKINDTVDSQADAGSGLLVVANVPGVEIPVALKGNIQLDSEGNFDRARSSNLIYTDPASGRQMPVGTQFIDIVDIAGADNIKQEMGAKSDAQIDTQYENMNAPIRQNGDKIRFQTKDANGNVTGTYVGIVQGLTKDGTGYIVDAMDGAGQIIAQPRDILDDSHMEGVQIGTPVIYTDKQGKMKEGEVTDLSLFNSHDIVSIDGVEYNSRAITSRAVENASTIANREGLSFDDAMSQRVQGTYTLEEIQQSQYYKDNQESMDRTIAHVEESIGGNISVEISFDQQSGNMMMWSSQESDFEIITPREQEQAPVESETEREKEETEKGTPETTETSEIDGENESQPPSEDSKVSEDAIKVSEAEQAEKERAEFMESLPRVKSGKRKGEIRAQDLTAEQTIRLFEYEFGEEEAAAGARQAAAKIRTDLKKAEEVLAKDRLDYDQRKKVEQMRADLKLYDDYSTAYHQKQQQANAQAMQTTSLKEQRQQQDQKENVRAPGEAGQNIKDVAQNATVIEGFEDEIVTPTGQVLKGKWVLVEAEEIFPSHDPSRGFAQTEGFPQNEDGSTVNDRDYGADKTAQGVVQKHAANFDQRAIQDAPTIDENHIIINGNNRGQARQLSARNGTDGAYTEALSKPNKLRMYGFTEEGYSQLKHPTLAFKISEALPYTTETFAMFNVEEKKSQSNLETAVKASKTIKAVVVRKIANIIGKFDNLSRLYASESATQDIVDILLAEGSIKLEHVPALKDGNKLSPAGQSFLETIMIGAVLGEQAIRETDAMPSVRQTVMRIMPQLMDNAALGEYGLSEEINNALHLLYEGRQFKEKQAESKEAKGEPKSDYDNLRDYMRQTNMFGEGPLDVYTATERTLALMLLDGDVKARQTLDSYNERAKLAADGVVDMFEGKVLNPTELFNNLLQHYAKDAYTDQSTTEQGRGATESQTESSPPVNERVDREGQDSRQESSEQGQSEKTAAQEVELESEEEAATIEEALAQDPIRDITAEEQAEYVEVVNELSELFGVPVQAHTSLETVENQRARDAIEQGEKEGKQGTKGWYDGTAHVYIPNATSRANVVATFMHEAMAHKGVKEAMGTERYNKSLEALFDKLPEQLQQSLLEAYGDKLTAADEFMASQAEDGTFMQNQSRRSVVRKLIDGVKLAFAGGQQKIRLQHVAAIATANEMLNEAAKRMVKETGSKLKRGESIVEFAERKLKENQIDEAAKAVDINPTEGQKKAGNYKKGHVKINGFDITIENPKGSERSGTDSNGRAWSITMNNHYGYFKLSEAIDGDHVDVFIGDNMNSDKVFVIDQINPETKQFDENKVMMGFDSMEEAKQAYLSNYEDGWRGMGEVTEVSTDTFKDWLYRGHKQQKPFSQYKSIQDSQVDTRLRDTEYQESTEDDFDFFAEMQEGESIADYAKRVSENNTRLRNAEQQEQLKGLKGELRQLENRLKQYKQEYGRAYRKYNELNKKMKDDPNLGMAGQGVLFEVEPIGAPSLFSDTQDALSDARAVVRQAKEKADDLGYKVSEATREVAIKKDEIVNATFGQKTLFRQEEMQKRLQVPINSITSFNDHHEWMDARNEWEFLREDLKDRTGKAVLFVESAHNIITFDNEAVIAAKAMNKPLTTTHDGKYMFIVSKEEAIDMGALYDITRLGYRVAVAEKLEGEEKAKADEAGRRRELEQHRERIDRERGETSDPHVQLRRDLGLSDSVYGDGHFNMEIVDPVEYFREHPEKVIHDISWHTAYEIVPTNKPLINIYNSGRSLYKLGTYLKDLQKLREKNLMVFKPGTTQLDLGKASQMSREFNKAIDGYARALISTKQISTEAVQREINDILRKIEYSIDYYQRAAQGADMMGEEFNPRFRDTDQQSHFYSTIESALPRIKQERGTKEQFKAMLLRNGAKMAELNWMDWDALPDRLTKDEIQEWVNENRIEVKEVMKGIEPINYQKNPEAKDFAYDLIREEVSRSGNQEMSDLIESQGNPLDKWYSNPSIENKRELEPILNDLGIDFDYINEQVEVEQDDNPTQYHDYAFEDGENYKELLLTIPTKVQKAKAVKAEGGWKIQYPDGTDSPFSYASKEWAEKAIREGVSQERSGNSPKTIDAFTSGHFDEKNVVAHVRFNERTFEAENKDYIDPNSQSYNFDDIFELIDIGESYQVKNKETGSVYASWYPKDVMKKHNMTTEGLKKHLMERPGLKAKHPEYRRLSEAGETTKQKVLFIEELQSDWAQEGRDKGFREHRSYDHKVFMEGDRNKAPDMPFKTTDQWLNLSLRRMMKYAADNGFDYVAWTTGQHQADRYSLSNTINEVSATREHDQVRVSMEVKGRDNITFVTKNGKITEGDYSGSELSDVVGKELAKKIESTETASIISGDGLEVGGEGMKTFYNNIVPSQANKIGRPFKSRVEVLDMGGDVGQVLGMPVTQQMKDKTREGVPLFRDVEQLQAIKSKALKDGTFMFAPNGEQTNLPEQQWLQTQTNAFKEWFGDSKIVDENGEPRVVYHQTKSEWSEYDSSIAGAGKYDYHMPNGIFTKTTQSDIGLGDAQIPLYMRAENPLRLKDRSEAEVYFAKNAEGYKDIIRQIADSNKKHQANIDALMKQHTERMKAMRLSGEYIIPSDAWSDAIKKSSQQTGEALKAWTAEINDLSAKAKAVIDDYFKNSAYDAVVVSQDEGSMGRVTDAYIALSPNQIKSSVDNTGEFSSQSNDIRFRILGEQGAAALDAYDQATRRMDNLGTARAMVESGKNAKAIKRATGWEKGADGKWRYELSGEKITIPQNVEDSTVGDILGKDSKLIKAYPELEDMSVVFHYDPDTSEAGSYHPEFKFITVNHRAYGSIEHNQERAKEQRALIDSYNGKDGVLMAELATGKKGEEARAQAINDALATEERSLQAIEKAKSELLEERRETIMHEIQHAIQQIEGFESGANPALARRGVERVYNDILYEIEGINLELDNAVEKETGKSLKEWTRERGLYSDIDTAERLLKEGVVGNSVAELLEKESEARSAATRYDMLSIGNPSDLYWRTAGEVEARNTSKRMDMTAEEVRNTLLESTEDVSRYDQILIRKGLSYAESTRFREAGKTEQAIEDGMAEAYRQQFDERYGKFSTRLREAWEDQYLPVGDFQKMLSDMGVTIDEHNDFYKMATHLPGANDEQIRRFHKQHQRAITNAIHELRQKGISFRDVENYVMMVHGIERNEYMRNREIAQFDEAHEHTKLSPESLQAKRNKFIEELPEDYSGITAIEKEVDKGRFEYISEFEEKAGEQKLIDDLWSAIKNATNFSLQKQLESGQLSQESYDHISSMYENFVPLRGHDDQTAEDRWDYTPNMGTFYSLPIAKAEGRRSRAATPFAYIEQMAHTAIVHGNANKLKQTMWRLAHQDTNGLMTLSKSWQQRLETEDGDVWIPVSAEYSDNYAEYIQNQKAFEQKMEELKKDGNARIRKGGLEIGGMFIKNQQAKQHEVQVYHNGTAYTLYINANPAIARSMNGDNMKGINFGLFGEIGRQMAANFTTRNPSFMATNFARDYILATTLLGIKEGMGYMGNFQRNIPRAAAAIAMTMAGKQDVESPSHRYYQEFLLNGGATGFSKILELNTVAKRLEREAKKGGKKTALDYSMVLFDAIGAVNDLIENTTRLATYMSSREDGRTVTQSIHDAKNVTVNFNQKGAGSSVANNRFEAAVINSVQFVRPLYLFANAAIQSLSNVGKVYKAHPKKMTGVVTGLAFAGFVGPIIASLVGGEGAEEEYMMLGEWERQNNFCIYTPNGFVKIPIPHELRVFYKMGDNVYQTIREDKSLEDAFIDTMHSFSDLLPTDPLAFTDASWAELTPDAARPFAQIAANTTFMGTRIYNEWAPEGSPGYTKVSTNREGIPYTAQFMIEMFKQLDHATGGDGVTPGMASVNPDIVNHFMRGYFGGLWTVTEQTINMIHQGAQGDQVQWKDTPLRPFFTHKDDLRVQSGVLGRQYGDLSRDVAETLRRQRQYKKQLEAGELGVSEYAKKLHQMDYGAKNELNKMLKKIKDKERQLKELKGKEQKDLQKQIADMKREAVEKSEEIRRLPR